MDFLYKLLMGVSIIFLSVLTFWFYGWIKFLKLSYDKMKNRDNTLIPKENNKIIFILHKGENGVGYIYNTNTDDDPYWMVSVSYENGANQHIKLTDIEKYNYLENDK